ncbi:hypothetical protein V4B17_02305 [Bartonella sp. B23]
MALFEISFSLIKIETNRVPILNAVSTVPIVVIAAMMAREE